MMADLEAIQKQLEALQGMLGQRPAELSPTGATVLINPKDRDTIEKAKWEQFETPVTMAAGLRPGNPYKYRPYPKMLARAQQVPPGFPDAGKYMCALSEPRFYGYRDQDEWSRACEEARHFTKACQRIVNNEEEYKRARDEGWRDDSKEALAYQAELQKMISDAAAERNYRDRLMSEKAKAESEAASAAHFEEHLGHAPDVPVAPVKRRGRPPKNAA